MAEKIAENLYQLDIPLVGNPLKNLNSYLITGERNLLIDTGFREQPCREAMERELDELHVDLNRTDIFLTHLHSDHAGLSTELHRPGCQIFISEIDKHGILDHEEDAYWQEINRRYEHDGFSHQEMLDLWGTNPAQEKRPELFRDYTALDDGDTISYGGYALQGILTPGHTPGHLCLYAPEEKILFSGDHVLFHITPNICRWDTMPDALGSYLESLQKIRNLPVETLLPAHRYETGVLSARVDELTAHHERRLDNTLAVLRQQPGLTAYQIAGAMRWQIRCKSWEDFPLTQKFFAVGEALAHLDHLQALGLAESYEKNDVFCWSAV
ncbi:MAG: MBL fold metallo-hydrolase [Oscillibacter sp.]|jgi:glyoxylase-like metal-dependent hydrolase (beta-lactamase superfamily II)|nr:MBL fold metallo-hydrolase [Oscillibacter sp.]